MKIFLLLLFIGISICDAHNVVCYHGTWSTYRHGDGNFNIEDIDPNICTHLIYSFVGLNPTTNKIKVLDAYFDSCTEYSKCSLQKFVALKNLNPKVKVILAIGGWEEGSMKYSKMAMTRHTRKIFVDSVVEFVLEHGFDGFDMDWEYPARRRGSAPEDKENFVSLLKELKEAFAPHGLILSAAVGAGKDTIDHAYDIPRVSQHLDLINLMTYDLHGSWEPFTHHHSILHSHPLDEGTNNTYLSVDFALNYWISKGADPQKINLGMPLYGRCFALKDKSINGIYAPATKPYSAGPYTKEPNFRGYNEICEGFLTSDNYVKVNDPRLNEPYAIFEDVLWCGYDDADSLKKKVEFLKSKNLGGAMIWSVETDDFLGICHDRPNHLTKTVVETLTGAQIIENQPNTHKYSEVQKLMRNRGLIKTDFYEMKTDKENPEPFKIVNGIEEALKQREGFVYDPQISSIRSVSNHIEQNYRESKQFGQNNIQSLNDISFPRITNEVQGVYAFNSQSNRNAKLQTQSSDFGTKSTNVNNKFNDAPEINKGLYTPESYKNGNLNTFRKSTNNQNNILQTNNVNSNSRSRNVVSRNNYEPFQSSQSFKDVMTKDSTSKPRKIISSKSKAKIIRKDDNYVNQNYKYELTHTPGNVNQNQVNFDVSKFFSNYFKTVSQPVINQNNVAKNQTPEIIRPKSTVIWNNNIKTQEPTTGYENNNNFVSTTNEINNFEPEAQNLQNVDILRSDIQPETVNIDTRNYISTDYSTKNENVQTPRVTNQNSFNFEDQRLINAIKEDIREENIESYKSINENLLSQITREVYEKYIESNNRNIIQSSNVNDVRITKENQPTSHYRPAIHGVDEENYNVQHNENIETLQKLADEHQKKEFQNIYTPERLNSRIDADKMSPKTIIRGEQFQNLVVQNQNQNRQDGTHRLILNNENQENQMIKQINGMEIMKTFEQNQGWPIPQGINSDVQEVEFNRNDERVQIEDRNKKYQQQQEKILQQQFQKQQQLHQKQIKEQQLQQQLQQQQLQQQNEEQQQMIQNNQQVEQNSQQYQQVEQNSQQYQQEIEQNSFQYQQNAQSIDDFNQRNPNYEDNQQIPQQMIQNNQQIDHNSQHYQQETEQNSFQYQQKTQSNDDFNQRNPNYEDSQQLQQEIQFNQQQIQPTNQFINQNRQQIQLNQLQNYQGNQQEIQSRNQNFPQLIQDLSNRNIQQNVQTFHNGNQNVDQFDSQGFRKVTPSSPTFDYEQKQTYDGTTIISRNPKRTLIKSPKKNLIVSSDPEPSNECKQKGFNVVNNDCSGFVICNVIAGEWSFSNASCGPESLFNPKTMVCDLPANVCKEHRDSCSRNCLRY